MFIMVITENVLCGVHLLFVLRWQHNFQQIDWISFLLWQMACREPAVHVISVSVFFFIYLFRALILINFISIFGSLAISLNFACSAKLRQKREREREIGVTTLRLESSFQPICNCQTRVIQFDAKQNHLFGLVEYACFAVKCSSRSNPTQFCCLLHQMV